MSLNNNLKLLNLYKVLNITIADETLNYIFFFIFYYFYLFILFIYLFFFSEKIRFDISCEYSARADNSQEMSSYFSESRKKKKYQF